MKRALPSVLRRGRPRRINQSTVGRPELIDGKDTICVCGQPYWIGTDGNGGLVERCTNPYCVRKEA